MNAPSENDWTPDPQLLAAYFDGELEGRDKMADMCVRIEAWLEMHPQAADAWAEHRRLRELWAETTPPEPAPALWSQTLAEIETGRRLPAAARAGQRPWLAAGLFVASLALFLFLLFNVLRQGPENLPVVMGPQEKPSQALDQDLEIFAVASASEVTILHIDGEDTVALVVGALPLDGPMELAERGEVRVIRCCPKTIQVRETGRPMVSPRVDTE